MSSNLNPPQENNPLSLSSLLARYVQSQAEAREQGMAGDLPTGEVLPYDAGPVRMVEPATAWDDACFALPDHSGRPKPCPEWAALVAAQEPVLSVPFCVGNFPQMVRNFLPVLQGGVLRPVDFALSEASASAAYSEWAEQSARGGLAEKLLAVGVLRLAQDFEGAEKILDEHESALKGEARVAWRNERAALEWHRGNHAEALRLWESQEPTPLVLFNRGMAALFLGQAAKAHTTLTQTAAALPEDNAWHHLAQLYLTLSAVRA